MSTKLLDCIDTIRSAGGSHDKAASAERASEAVDPVPALPKSAAPAMLMASRDIVPLVVRIAERLSAWQDRRAGRRQLMTLDARALKDIGLDRAAAEEEWRKPFWR